MSREIIENALRRLQAHQLLATGEVSKLRRAFLASESTTDDDPAVAVDAFLEALIDLGVEQGRAVELVQERQRVTGPHTGNDTRPVSSGPSAPTRPGGRTRRVPIEDSWSPPHYEILDEIGTGAVGDVFRARDLRLGRLVALKAMVTDGPFDRERFLLEARHQARVEHPAVCKVYEVGEHGGRPFLSMQLIEGRTLQEMADELSTEQKVELIRQVAEGVHAAHSTGLIHRDLKPANIMLEATDEGLRAYVLDFGIAREEDGPSLTRTGMVVGTPWYMAPEQVTGRGSALDRRTDVYGLGTVLYELFAGRPPFAEESSMAALSRVLTEEAPRLRESMVDVPRDLERIVEQCLRKNPGERYPTARALAEDLARYLEGDPVEATDGGPLGRLRRWARRHRALAAVSAVAVLATFAFAVTAVRSRMVAERTARVAQSVGREVERVEWLLRSSRLLPLHDMATEKADLKQRLQRFGQTTAGLAGLGARGRLIEQYVVGRGALLLGELDEARQSLEAAWQGGYREPEVAEALGWTLAEIYDREQSLLRGLATDEEEDRRAEELSEQLLGPALDYLEAARDSQIGLGGLVEAQIAFYGGDWDTALLRAAELERVAPWLYEATVLRARVLMEEVHADRESVDRLRALQLLDRAEATLRQALAVGRSDHRVYRGLCELARTRLHLLVAPLTEATAVYERGLDDCAASLVIDGGDVETFLQRARLRLEYLAHREQGGQDTSDVQQSAEADALQVLERRPDFAVAYDVLGTVAYAEAQDLLRTGGDPWPAVERAIELQEQALEHAPRRATSHQRIAQALWLQGQYVEGVERIELLEKAQRATERLLEIDAEWPAHVASAANGSLQLADALNTNGLDPNQALDRAIDLYGDAVRRDPQAAWVYSNTSIVHLIRSRHQMRVGIDPVPALRAARSSVAQALELQPQDPIASFNLGESHRQEARWLTLGGVPEASQLEQFWRVIERGRAAYAEGLEMAPRIGQAWVDQARFDVMAAEVLVDLGAPATEIQERLRAARQALERSISIDARRAAAPCELSLVEVLQAEVRGDFSRAASEDARGMLAACAGAGATNADYLRSGLRAAWRLAVALPAASLRAEVVEVGGELARQATTVQPDFVEAAAYGAALRLIVDPAGELAGEQRAIVRRATQRIGRLAPRFERVAPEAAPGSGSAGD